jgi:hypothetical protein
MYIFKKIVVIVAVLALILCFTGFSAKAEAALLPSFGGLETMVIPCTCTVGLLAWHFFAPLYLNTSVPIAGAMTGAWVTTLPHYVLHPGAYALGTFTPGASVCFIGVPPYCLPLPSLGFISPLTGTSL